MRAGTAARTEASGLVAPALLPGAVGAALLVLLSAATGLLWSARAGGVTYWGTSAAFLIGLPASILGTAAAGWHIQRQGHPRVAAWVHATAGSILLYFVGVALITRLAVVEGRSDSLTAWIALFALGGHIAPIVLSQAVLLAVRDVLLPGRNSRPMVLLLIGTAAASLLVGAASMEPGPPLERVRPPLAGTWVEALATDAVWFGVWLAWLLSVLVGPIALWRAVGRSSGPARRRLAIAAVAALLPVTIIASCVLVLPVLTLAELSETVAIEVLFAFFAAIFPLTMAGLAVALSGGDAGLRIRSGRLAAALSLTVGLLFTLVAVLLSTLLAIVWGGGSVPVAVAATAVVVAGLSPLRRTVARRLLLRSDPRLALAARRVREESEHGGGDDASTVREILREALDDPTADVAFRLRATDGWVSPDGSPAPPPGQVTSAALTLVPEDPVTARCYVTHATSPPDAAGPIAEVSAMLDRAALEVTVRHQSLQLAQERARAERAAAEERRRLERDLHDGVQGRLLAVALELQSADGDGAGERHVALANAVSALRGAIEEIRRLGNGAAPEILARDGLPVALEDLVRRMPLPVSLTLPEGRLASGIETLTYLVVSEGLTNAVKHARPCSVDVSVAAEAERLTIRNSDDGAGGADIRAGSGLRGLSERVQALGGSFIVSERSPHGTVLEACVPCGR